MFDSAYDFGYEVIARPHLDDWKNSIFIIHPEDELPHFGHVTEWRLYANISTTTNLTLIIFRPDLDSPIHHKFDLVGYNNVTITTTGAHSFPVPKEKMVRFQPGDVIGLYFMGTNPIPFTKGDPNGCTKGTLYVQQPCSFNTCSSYTFRDKQPGWNPCRKYSLTAHIVNDSEYYIKVIYVLLYYDLCAILSQIL